MIDPEMIKETYLCNSLAGIKIPLLTITEPSESESLLKKRPVIYCTGRIHPGETNGSWMLHVRSFYGTILRDLGFY